MANKSISAAHCINETLDKYLKYGVLQLAEANGSFVVKNQDDYLNIYKMSLDDVRGMFPNEYRDITSNNSRAFTFEQMVAMFREGLTLHAYICRTNQEPRYHFIDMDDYTEGSKYRERYERHKDNTDYPNEKVKYNI